MLPSILPTSAHKRYVEAVLLPRESRDAAQHAPHKRPQEIRGGSVASKQSSGTDQYAPNQSPPVTRGGSGWSREPVDAAKDFVGQHRR